MALARSPELDTALLSVFSICVVMLGLWSQSSIAAHFVFCFTSLL